MIFSDFPYSRPNIENVKKDIQELTKRLSTSKTYDEAKEAFLNVQKISKSVETQGTLAHIRHSIDTRDEFYYNEVKFWNNAGPELQEYSQLFIVEILKSPFRKELSEEYGEIFFKNAEIELKTFSPEIISELQQENDLTQEYEKLLASAQIPFMGKTYTLSQLTPLKNDKDDDIRLNAWKAEGKWYKDNQGELDDIYDKLVHLRDEMGRKLGYDGYTELGYNRMGRNCYTKEDVEVFRKSVVKYLVPVADSIFRKQAERIGKEYPLSFADAALSFRSGNPLPRGDADDIVKAAKKFYDELSPETSEFFRTMLDMELMDLLSTDGKEAGGYCTELLDYEVPFIFANFNGTSGDVEVVTHEAGHAFEAWLNRKRVPIETIAPTLEACEVHSMSMEFFAWRAAEDFFGKDSKKFYYSHLAGALKFIPYGTMVDHFQHIVFEKPDMSPAERHAVWKELLGTYMPWLRLDGDIPFYSDGEGWQRQHHIYSYPFYYIDYCLAQTVALEFWAMIQEDPDNAWKHYMAYTSQGGSDTFTNMLEKAELVSPFNEECLKGVCEKANNWLENYDLTGIE